MPEAFDINQYVLTGRGDPQKALAGLYYWTWDTEEVLELIRWMRKWNENPKHPKVKFYGFDMRAAPRAAQVALAYLARVAPAESPPFATALAPLANAVDVRTVAAMTSDEQKALSKSAGELVARLDAERASWTARSSAQAGSVTRQHARILEQYLDMTRLGQAGGEARDRAMAENIGWIADH